jgi:hypothetical protein
MFVRMLLAPLLAIMLLAGCSFQQTLNAMVDEERQAALIQTAQTLCSNPAALRDQFSSELWAQSEPLFPQLPSQCPPHGGFAWRLTTFQFNSAADVGGDSSRREYAVIVAGGDSPPWTEVELNYESRNGGPLQIVGWNAQRLETRPPSLTFIDNWEKVRFWIAIGVVLVVLLISGLIFWLVRRRRQRGGIMAP